MVFHQVPIIADCHPFDYSYHPLSSTPLHYRLNVYYTENWCIFEIIYQRYHLQVTDKLHQVASINL